MTKDEIYGMLKLSGVSMIIDRLHLSKYGGIFREVVILNKTCIRVDFLDKDCKLFDEGELSVYFEFDSFDSMIEQTEKFINKKTAEWKRYFTDPEIFNNESPEWNEAPNWKLFDMDFSNSKIELPANYSNMHVYGEYS